MRGPNLQKQVGSASAGRKFGLRGTLKPDSTQAGVLFAHDVVCSRARPLETFFSPFPIVGGRRRRFVLGLGPRRLGDRNMHNARWRSEPEALHRTPLPQQNEMLIRT
jgi:hypothetical protein